MRLHQVEGVAVEEEPLVRAAATQCLGCSSELPQLVERETVVVLGEL